MGTKTHYVNQEVVLQEPIDVNKIEQEALSKANAGLRRQTNAIDRLKQKIADELLIRERKISNLLDKISSLTKEVSSLKEEAELKTIEVTSLNVKNAELSQRIENLLKQHNDVQYTFTNEIISLNEKTAKLSDDLRLKEKDLKKSFEDLESLKTKLSNSDEYICSLEKEKESLNLLITNLNSKIKEMDSTFVKSEKMLSTNLSEYKEQLDFFNKEFVKKDDTIRNLSREIVSIRNELSKKTDDGRKVFICNERISNLEKLLKEKDIVISSLIKELEKNKIAVSISSHLQPVLANSYRERVKQLHE